MGYIVTDADIPDLPLRESDCETCEGNGGHLIVTSYDEQKQRQETHFDRTCDDCEGRGKCHDAAFGLEARRESFIFSTADERVEIAYDDFPVLEAYIQWLRENRIKPA